MSKGEEKGRESEGRREGEKRRKEGKRGTNEESVEKVHQEGVWGKKRRLRGKRERKE